MTDPTETAAPVTTDRAFSTADLAYINRMTTTGMVLPSVAHEVNNSLQVIAGMVEILGLRGQLPPEVSDKVQKIAVQATKAAGHLRELVAFARRDGVSPKVELKAAVERAVVAAALLPDARPRRRDDRRAGRRIAGRPGRQPARRAGAREPGHQRGRVGRQAGRAHDSHPRRGAHGGAAHVEFVDSGPGFDAAIESRVGEPFLTNKPAGAAGLGLAVAKRLVEADGGTLTISAMPAVVTVSWPDAV